MALEAPQGGLVSTARGEFIVQLANLLKSPGRPAETIMHVRSVAVLTPVGSADQVDAVNAPVPGFLLEVCLEDGTIFHISVEDMTGRVPHL
ncbi:MAG: hypothetical protein ACREAA_19785 [Candidatus Polarisedimenticolia bacterium]